MNYMKTYNHLADKLGGVLTEHGLVYTFRTNSYPMTLIISPDASPEAQMAMFDTGNDNATSSDARLIFTFPVDEIGIRVQGRLVMSDALMSKVKGLAKKMHKAYCEGFLACAIERDGGDDLLDDLDDGEDIDEEDEDATFDEFYEDEDAEDGEEE